MSPSIIFVLFVSVMRLGKKKEKDRDGEKEQCIDGVARLICSAKQSHPVPLRGELRNHKAKTLANVVHLPSISSLHRWHRVDRRQVLPAIVAVANAREELSSGFNRRSIIGDRLKCNTTAFKISS